MYQTEVGSDLNKAADYLNRGLQVAIPTETVYGLAASALNYEAVAGIYTIKQRPSFNPLILHVADVEAVASFAGKIHLPIERLMHHFMPGPLTVLVPKADIISDMITAGSDLVAIRVPAHPIAHALLSILNFPLCAPSANKSGYVSPTNAQHCLEGLEGLIPYILEGGSSAIGLESTIVGYDPHRHEVIIYRSGSIDREELTQVSGCEVIYYDQRTKTPQTAGQLKSHYATRKPLFVGNIEKLRNDHSDKNPIIIRLKKQDLLPNELSFSQSDDLSEIAHHLFSTLRLADSMSGDIILTEWAEPIGIGVAINDRLSRAQYIMKDKKTDH